MRILIIMAGFFPGKKYGGPPVSIDNFCSLMKEHECYIVTSNHDLSEQEKYTNITESWNQRSNCKVLYLSDSDYNKVSFESVMEAIKPNVLYLQGLFQKCVFPCLKLAKKMGISVLLAPRGELCAGALNIKKTKKVIYIKLLKTLGLIKNVHFQSTSEEETEAIITWFKLNSNRIHPLINIPSIPKKEYVRRYKNSGVGRFVFLSRIHPKKNLLSAIDYFDKIRDVAFFDIYGPIEDEGYWAQCKAKIEQLPTNIHVEYKGLIEHDQVHSVFSQYDSFLFPTFSENYGHVIAESLFVGTPVIISDQTPWTDVNNYGAGWAYDLSLKENFQNAIQMIIASDEIIMQQISNCCKEYVLKKTELVELKEEYNSVFRLLGGN